MAVIKSDVQAPVSLTVTGLATLASATYVVSNVLSHSVNDPLDVLIDVAIATTNTPAGNRQVVIFAKGSLDGSNFGSGPESGTTATDEPDLHYVGSLPMNTATTTHRKVFSLAAAYGGVLPASTKLVFKNDLGVTITSASVQTSEVWGTAV
jgi:hypothetical protein